MGIDLVAADNPVREALEREIGKHLRALSADGTAIADHAARGTLEARVREHLHPLCAEVVLDLHLVPFAVTAHQDHHRTEVGVEDERLHELRGRLAEERADVVDRLRSRRVEGGQLGHGSRLGVVIELRRGLLHVRAIVAVRATDDGILARLREHHELV